MIKVLDVAYARFQAPDLDLMEQFLGDFGLTHLPIPPVLSARRNFEEVHHIV